MKKQILTGLAFMGVLAVSEDAFALACDATGLAGTPVYVAGSSAAKPMLKQISNTLAAAAQPVRLIYVSLGSCLGLSQFTTNTNVTATAVYWDANLGEQTCTYPTVQGVPADIAISDVYASSCANVTVPADEKDFTGSAQIFGLVVPPTSKETSISMEAGLVIYGFGGVTNPIDPWTDVNYIFKRDPTASGTYAMLSKVLGLDPAKMKGTIPGAGKSGDILTAVHNADATAPNKAIGVLSADYFDANRTGMSAVKLLAYQHKGAACGLFPDSSSSALDKANVRAGLYPFWGPLHFLVKVDNQGNPSSMLVKEVLSFFTRTGLDDTNKKKMIDNEVAAFTVPQCAMKVKRTAEVAPVDSGLSSYDSPEPCGCYYEYKATNATTCKACPAGDGDCSGNTPKCRYGYCEAK